MEPDSYLQAIEQELERSVEPSVLALQGNSRFEPFLRMLRYHLGWVAADGSRVAADAGKRFRPLIVLWSCEAAGGEWARALPAAAAVELVHNFSLIHDDIQDDSAERRGRAALWKIWGMPQGINAGDAMFVLARMALDRLDVVPADLAAIHAVFDSATCGLTQGQFLDLSFQDRERVSVEEYVEMVKGKTGALLACSAEIGARTATPDEGISDSFRAFGENLGVAFQIADDVLGIWGDPAVTGKPAGDDLYARKKSLPVIAALGADSTGRVAAFLRQASSSREDVSTMREIMQGLGAREWSERQADEYMARALSALDSLALAGPATDRLRDLARRAVRRQK
ncbi:MAG: polyprenyl synthetase family protein [Rudaea sp.]